MDKKNLKNPVTTWTQGQNNKAMNTNMDEHRQGNDMDMDEHRLGNDHET